MTKMIIRADGFDWDAGNVFKNEAKHDISRETVEAFFSQKLWVDPAGQTLIRPISARYMHAKEAKRYEEAFTPIED